MKNLSRHSGKKILLIAQSGIGNFLMQSPVFKILKQHDPLCQLTVFVAPRGTKELAAVNPYIDRTIEGKGALKTSWRNHWRQIRQLREQRFDIGIVLSPGQLWKSALYLKLAGIPMRIGHSYPWPTAKPSGLFLTHAVPEKALVHDIEQNLALVAPLGIAPPPPGDTRYELILPTTAMRAADSYLAGRHLTGRQLIGFHAGSLSSMLWKRWPKENYIAVGKELLAYDPSIHILLFGGPDEVALNRSIAHALGDQATVVETDLLTTAALIARCGLFVSNDSGLMHVAAAVGAATIGLFGPTDERLTGPRGTQSQVLRTPGTTGVYNTERNARPQKQASGALLALSPATVIAMAKTKLSVRTNLS